MLRFVFALLFVCVFGAAEAQPRLGTATVTAELTPDGLRAEVRLSRAVSVFDFMQTDVVREGDVQVLTPGLTLSGDSVRAEQPFRRFAVLIRPMTQERDAKYPAFFRVGDGGVLYAPTLLGARETWRTRLRIETARGHTTAPSRGPRELGSIYIGPAAYVTATDQAIVIAPPDTPPQLREAAAGELLAAMRLYTRELNTALPTRPVLVLANGGPGEGHVGDVTPGPFVSLRFHGAGWTAPPPEMRTFLSRFVSHEAFHFWNGSLVNSGGDTTPSWLHEGGADYAALLSAIDAGAADDNAARMALGDALTRCRAGLQAQGDVGMNSLAFLSQAVRYPCGIVIQWAADLKVRAASNGERGFFDVWAEMIAAAQARPSTLAYTLDDFYTASGLSGSTAPISLLTETNGVARWPALVESLRGLGAEIVAAPTRETRRQAMLFHLLGQSCAGAETIGFFAEGNRIRVQEESCGVLAGGPTLASIEGGDPFEATPETYARVQAACAANRDVAITLVDGRTVQAPCRRALPNAPDAYVVTGRI